MSTTPVPRRLSLALLAAGALLALPDAAQAQGNPFDRRKVPEGRVRRAAGQTPAKRGAVKPRKQRPRKVKSGVHYIRSDDAGANAAGGKEKRWARRKNGRRVAAADWDQSKCVQSQAVGTVTYLRCDGAWWERVYEGGDVVWVEVVRPS
jgi:hypothetical protein